MSDPLWSDEKINNLVRPYYGELFVEPILPSVAVTWMRQIRDDHNRRITELETALDEIAQSDREAWQYVEDLQASAARVPDDVRAAIEHCLDHLCSVFSDDANNMPDALYVSYMMVGAWLVLQEAREAQEWEPVDVIQLDDGLEMHADHIAVTVGQGNTALATYQWPDDGYEYAVCKRKEGE